MTNKTDNNSLNTTQRSLPKIYPWIAIALSALFLFYKYVLQVYPSIITAELMQEYHFFATGLGNLTATFFYAYVVTQIFVGVLLDKFSVRILSTLALLVCSVGAYLFSVAYSLWVAELARCLMGIGAAFATVSYLKIAAVWFRPDQFAFVGGLLSTAAMLGAAFGEAPLSLIVDRTGWRTALMITALFGLVIATLYALIIRDNPQRKGVRLKTAITLRDVLCIIKNKQNWLLTLYSGMTFSPVAVFGGLWGNPFLETMYHISKTSAAFLISMVFYGLAVGGPVLGLLSDRLHNRRTLMLIGNIAAFILIVIILYWPGIPLVVLATLLFLFGFFIGAFMLAFAIGRQINKLAMAATVIALINTGDAIFGAFNDPLVGKLLDLNWQGKIIDGVHYFTTSNYQVSMMLLPAYLFIATILVFFIREPKYN